MQFGMMIMARGPGGRAPGLTAMAQAAENGGLDMIGINDHVSSLVISIRPIPTATTVSGRVLRWGSVWNWSPLHPLLRRPRTESGY